MVRETRGGEEVRQEAVKRNQLRARSVSNSISPHNDPISSIFRSSARSSISDSIAMASSAALRFERMFAEFESV